MPTQLPIGERIKQQRKAERLTAKAFAEKYGLDVSNLYKWEKGVKPSDIPITDPQVTARWQQHVKEKVDKGGLGITVAKTVNL